MVLTEIHMQILEHNRVQVSALKGVGGRIKRAVLHRHAGIVGKRYSVPRARGTLSYSEDESSSRIEKGMNSAGVGSESDAQSEQGSVIEVEEIPQCCSCGVGPPGPAGPPGLNGKDGW